MSEHRKLHPASVLIWIFEELRQFVLAFIPLLLGRGGLDRRLTYALAIAGIIVVVALIRYARFRYVVTEDSLIIEGGALFRYRRVLPRARIQSIDFVQKVRHQLFGVVELRVEVLGGNKTEGRLIALSPAEAERVRQELLTTTVDAAVVEAAPLVRLGPKDLLVAGLTGGRVAVLALMFGFFDDLLPESVWKRIDPTSLGIPPVFAIAAAAAGVLFLTLVVSLVMTVFAYWGFTVRREGDRLVITRGLLERRRAVVPLRRIQSFRVHENLLHRIFGLASVTVSVAGYSGSGDEVRQSGMLLPVGTKARAMDLVMGLLPVPLAIGAVPLEPAPLRALRRRIVRAVLVGIAAGLSGLLLWGRPGALAFGLAYVLVIPAYLDWRGLGHGIQGGYAVARSGGVVRTTSVVAMANIQVCEMEQTPLQRLSRLASFRLRIPKGAVRIVDLDAERATVRFDQIVTAMR